MATAAVSFEEYVTYFTPRELPVRFSSEAMEEHPLPTVPSAYSYNRPLYNLKNKTDFVVLITSIPADISTPVMLVYTKEGIKTDSLMLFKQPGGDEGYSRKEEVTIKKDLSIEAKYTIERYKTDNEGNTIEKSIKKEVLKEDFEINAEGKIVKK